MKIPKQLFATILLALALCATTYAGDISVPVGASAPGDMSTPVGAPAPGDIDGPSGLLASGDMQGPTAPAPGDIQMPGLTAIVSFLGHLAGY